MKSAPHLLLLLCSLLWAMAAGRSTFVPQHLSAQVNNVEALHLSDFHVTRGRRSLDGSRTLQFTALNRTFIMELSRDESIFTPTAYGVLVSEHGEQRFEIDRHNYLRGTLQGEPASRVTLYMNGDILHGNVDSEDGNSYTLEVAARHMKNTDSVSPADRPDVFVYNNKDVTHGYDPRTGQQRFGKNFCGHGHSHIHDSVEATAQRVMEQQHQRVHHSFGGGADNHGSASPAAAAGFSPNPRSPDTYRTTLQRQRRAQASATDNTCTMTLVSDSLFYVASGSSESAAVSQMVGRVKVADRIVNATLFGSLGGLRLAVQAVVVYNSTAGDPYYSASGYPGVNGPENLLTLFSSAPMRGPLGWSQTCLAHLFTNYDFDGGVLGLAYVGKVSVSNPGGICHNFAVTQPSATQWLNVGWSTDINFGERISTQLGQLVTSHEVGHNFGSPHDTVSPCTGDAISGRFLMYADAVDGSLPNNFLFSTCSRNSISDVLTAKGSCFDIYRDEICGNLNVEGNETCDAGSGGDACCFGSASAFKCSLKPPAICSDRNNECCLGCQLNSGKQCFTEFLNDAKCRKNTTCALQTGDVVCPLPPNKAADAPVVPCGQGGRCKGDDTTPLDERCEDFCVRYGASLCDCTGEDECAICCRHNASAVQGCNSPFASFGTQCVKAVVAVTETSTNNVPSCYASDPSSPATTRYQDNINADPTCTSNCAKLLNKVISSSCSIGFCNAEGVCTASAAKSTEISLSFSAIQEWARNNIVGAVMIVSLLLWIPIGCIIHRYDKKMRAKNKSYGRRKSGRGTLIHRSESRRRQVGQQPQPRRQPQGVARF
eukprot:m.70979 g.70979  ORF g.70979 m.70979 type:complete len:827 (+) comp16879_c0_seq1:456-2936(+)